ncbi:helix-turn-helix transcriptional regulator [Lacisediminihabitans changchengi]|nr:hypothetical protein [Lacisediminihabitans changchengi]
MGKLLKPKDITEMTGIATGVLAQRRFHGLPPTFLKPTPKTVLYREEDVNAWLEASAKTITGDAA